MDYRRICKSFMIGAASCALLFSTGCTVNPATGEQQFTGLMSPQQEKTLGAEQHQEIIKQYGGVYNHPGLQAYVNEIGQRLAKNTERPDVTYRFTLLDSPVVNAFALPGGYVYVTRGILAIANDEDELASVLAHEIGHVTARHQAARYSQGVLTALGASVVGAVIGSGGVSQALNMGSNLYMSSYSRDQESQADELGIRYLSRGGYDPKAMSRFLNQLDRADKLERAEAGKSGDAAASFLSSHPVTAERVARTSREATAYPAQPSAASAHVRYVSKLRGMTYGDSANQGFVRNQVFYHPELDFAFSIPDGYDVLNQPSQVIAKGRDGALLAMDMDQSRVGGDPMTYLVSQWLGGRPARSEPERMDVNGYSAATISAEGTFNNRPSTLRLVAISRGRGDMVRFQFVIPNGASAQTVEELKRTTYSFRAMTPADRRAAQPLKVAIVEAESGDTIESLSSRMALDRNRRAWFLTINGLSEGSKVYPGVLYKIIQ